MIGNTKSYARYRQLSQAYLDFVVLVCHAVPLLKTDLALPAAEISVAPDYFKKNTKLDLAGAASSYQAALSRSAHLTVFSYFEGYIKSTLQETAEFHGGPKGFESLAMKRTREFLGPLTPPLSSSRAKLQTYQKPAKADKYRKHTKILNNSGYRFPTELLAHYGVVNLIRKAKDDREGMRASEIGSILKDCYCYNISAHDAGVIDAARKVRNSIAHGSAPSVTLKSSMNLASKLRTIAAGVDRHIVEHFLVLQSFA
jgi:hypothetical protein